MVTLSDDELRARARAVTLVVSDVDGVLTDGTVLYSERGEELKRFSLRDGMGVERLRGVGVDTAFLTREKTGFTAARAAKLGVSQVHVGVRDKRAYLPELEASSGRPAREMAYIGDDDNDAAIMRAVVDAGGLAGAPAGAFETAREAAVHSTRAGGGEGAFREFAEWIIALRAGAP